MPKVGVDNEPLLERAIFGFDGADYRVVKTDTDGNIVVAQKVAGSTEVTQDTAADLNATVTIPTDQDIEARSFGWFSGDWQKNPLALGYSGDQSANHQDTNASSGTNTLTSATVPAGELWVVNFAQVTNTTRVITYVAVQAYVNSVTITLTEADSPAAARWTKFDGSVVMAEGDYLVGMFQGCSAGDDIYLRYHAVKVDIDQ